MFPAIADTYISSVDTGSNFGGKEFLEVTSSSNDFVGAKIAYLMFDISQVPRPSKILSAFIGLVSGSVTETHDIVIRYCPSKVWDEFDLTAENSVGDCLPATNSVKVATGGTTYTWDVTDSMVEALKNGETKVTFVVVSQSLHGTAWVDFYSREFSSEYAPTLGIGFSE